MPGGHVVIIDVVRHTPAWAGDALAYRIYRFMRTVNGALRTWAIASFTDSLDSSVRAAQYQLAGALQRRVMPSRARARRRAVAGPPWRG